MGSKGSNTSTTNTQAPAYLQGAYQDLVSRAGNVSQTPYQPYAGELVAGVNPQEQAGIGHINQYADWAQPYLNAAAGYTTNAAAPIMSSQIQGYENPEAAQVTQATLANFADLNAMQNQNVVGNAISSGAWGGDRASVAQAELARQQAGAEAPTLANINLQSYSTGLQTALTEQQQQAQAAYSLGNIGTAAQNAGLTGAGAMIQGGQLQQGTQQQLDTAQMQQYLTALAYPYQQLSWLGGLETGVGGVAGGTSSTTGPAPNPLNQILGLGATAAGAYMGMPKAPTAARGGRIAGIHVPHFDAGGTAPYSGGIGFIPSAPMGGRGGLPTPSMMLMRGNQPQGQGQQQGGGGGGLGNIGGAFGKYMGTPSAGPGIDTSGAGAGFPMEGSADAASLNVPLEGSTALGAGGIGSDAVAGLAPEAVGAADAGAAAGFSMADLLPLLAFAARGGRIHAGLGALQARRGFADGGDPTIDIPGGLQEVSPEAMASWRSGVDADVGRWTTAQGLGVLGQGEPIMLPPEITTGSSRPAAATPSRALAFAPDPAGVDNPDSTYNTAGPAAPRTSGINAASASAYSPNALNPNGGIGSSAPSVGVGAAAPDGRSWQDRLSLPLMQAGFAMMASRSPFVGEAIGQGGLSGIGAYVAQEKEARTVQEKEQEIGLRAKQLSDLAEQHAAALKQTTANQQQQRELEERKLAQTQSVPRAVGIDTFGKTVYGVLEPKSGTYVDPLTRQPIDMTKVTAGREAGMQSTAHMIANYALPPISPMRMATPEGQMLMKAVEAENPDYNSTFYNEANKARSAFGTGKQGDATRSFGTAISHLDVLSQATDALNNGDTKRLNQLKQFFQTELGLSTAPTSFDAIKPIVAAEITKAIVGGNMTQGDREEIQAGLRKDLATMNIKDVIDKYKQLMGGQLVSLERQYRTSTHGAKDFEDKLSPEAVDMLHRARAAERPATATTSPPAAAPIEVPPPAQRETGKTYQTPKGPATWTGGGWQLAAP